jgi:V/A-type H+-transporting ATPase subunit K
MKAGPLLLIGASLIGLLILGAAAAVLISAAPAIAQELAISMVDPGVLRWGFASGAAVAGVSALAAGYAVAQVGSAAVGALAEKPELLGRVLILVGLAEGIAIYGLIVAILIFNRLG